MKNNDTKLISNSIKSIFLILKAYFTVFCQGFKKNHPKEINQMPDKSGCLIECDYEKCTGCGLCIKVCPAIGALTIKEDNNGIKKLTIIDISRCAFCGNCIHNCPNNALNMTKQYKLATNDKKDLQLDCKKIFEEKLQKMNKTIEMPAFVNEDEV